jgi:NAD(P)H dehydrogenase (quinone)
MDVASAMSTLLHRDVSVQELPRTEWGSALRRGGLSESYAQLVMELYDAHNAGRIDAQEGVGEIRRGRTELAEALKPLVPAASG